MSSSGLSIKDFATESFTIEKYVEKLAQLDSNTGLGPMSKCEIKPFNSQVLLESFEGSMRTLQELAEKNQRRVDKLDHVCLKQEKEHAARIGELKGLYADAFSEFQVLEERIIAVSTKVVHLGDQLESSNCRRMRAMEAQNLMQHLKEFEKPRPTLPVFTDPGRKVEAGDLIFKLQMLSSELPQGKNNKYKEVKQKIARKYAEIEAQLVDAFIDAQRSMDTKRMRQYAQALAPFSLGFQKATDNYIHFNIPKSFQKKKDRPKREEFPRLTLAKSLKEAVADPWLALITPPQQQDEQQQFNNTDEMLSVVEKTCKKTHDQIVEVFDSPDVVMTKFIQAMLDKVLQKRIDAELKHLKKANSDNGKYLILLHNLYVKMMKLQEKLAKYLVSVDPQFLSKMTRINLFGKYLSTYTEVEIEHLSARSSYTLNDFQDMVGISLKTAPGRLGAGRPTVSANRQPEETYISQEVCTGIIHEAKCSIKRAKALLSDRELGDIARQIFLTVLDKLCMEHFQIALDLTQTIDLKTAPVGYFLTVVGHINNNMHLLEDLFREIIMPCFTSPSMASVCVARKREVASKLEAKIETGIEKTLTHMVSSVRQILSTHQKKSDFKPDIPMVIEGTQACNYVVSYVEKCSQVLHDSLDGKNLEIVLIEFGVSLHRVIFDSIQQFSINEIGAMVIICDMNEYRRVMKNFKNSMIDELFEGLQTLSNLFVVKAENIAIVCSEEPYANFDRSVLQAVIQLRSDSKTKGSRAFFKS